MEVRVKIISKKPNSAVKVNTHPSGATPWLFCSLDLLHYWACFIGNTLLIHFHAIPSDPATRTQSKEVVDCNEVFPSVSSSVHFRNQVISAAPHKAAAPHPSPSSRHSSGSSLIALYPFFFFFFNAAPKAAHRTWLSWSKGNAWHFIIS